MRRRPPGPVVRFGSLAVCAVALLVSDPSGAQDVRQDDVTDVVVIEVPVQVTKDGKPVRGLTPDQFEIRDGRKQRNLTGFDAYDLSGSRVESGPMAPLFPAAARRRFLFFFDLSLSAPDSIIRARDAAKELVSTGLDPSDLVVWRPGPCPMAPI